MLYRKLGTTGIDLSVLGFGCMRLPTINNQADNIDYLKATQLVHHAIDHGVNFVDTAYFYHALVFGQRGESEVFLGEALSGGWRKKVHVATKMPVFKITRREQMDAILKEQLERLRTGYVDFYLLHGLDGELWDRMRNLGVREFLDSRKSEGKFRYPAFSFHGKPEDFIRICNEYDWAYAQIQYNYMDISFQAGRAGLGYAAGKGMGVVVMEPLRGGKLARNLPVEAASILNSFPVKRSPAEWALRFVWNDAGVSSLLSGMNVMDQVEENIRVAGSGHPDTMSKDEMALIDSVRRTMEARRKADCTACRYCMPCPSGVDIPGVMASLNSFAIWNENDPWFTEYLSVNGKASRCNGCKTCEGICPQKIPISSLMKEAVSVFKS
jgi:uncharacterized protein